ncbi:N-acetylneuraminate synthase [Nonlabens marinus]|uniref:N-acetylneuraminate synthase n=1 Tax=Nonlabens marinus S1-08 TaxID=1454201 RepID=W8VXY6_9FLAO|nr:N-acetylneuraminate synthase [Nonlabens marinus]BAO56742.1 N-acetylneuraminate synthase [Nonlabens marinus S1-08]
MKHKTIIIAEAGVNHNGSLENAKKLVEIAAGAGADFVKFQTFKTELNITKNAKKAEYQELSTGIGESQFEMVKKLELSFDDFTIVKDYCDSCGIGFLSTGFDTPSLDFLETLNPKFYKIPSGEITNLPYLKKIASFGRDVVMSTGMASMEEVRNAFNILKKAGLEKGQISIVHCNTEYPTPMEDVNLKAMLHIKNELDVEIGYSDHTLGIEVPTAAVALGATIIEKHFTIDRNMTGPDHSASLEANELKSMVNAIRNIEKAIGGSGIKEPSLSESKNKSIVRKSIVAATDIKKGETFSEINLSVKRPGTGIDPMTWYDVLGTKASKDYKQDDPI